MDAVVSAVEQDAQKTTPSQWDFSCWVESSKVNLLLRELENLRSSGSKSIVFSQWTAFLDLLQIPLSRGWVLGPVCAVDAWMVSADGWHKRCIINVSKGWRSRDKPDCSFLCICDALKKGSMVESSCGGASCHAYSQDWTNKKCDDQTVYCEGAYAA